LHCENNRSHPGQPCRTCKTQQLSAQRDRAPMSGMLRFPNFELSLSPLIRWLGLLGGFTASPTL
jgi:hypothetical protein